MTSLPTSLRARVALVVLFGSFLIPLMSSSLRGLTHVLSCTAAIDATVVIDTTGDDEVLLSADSIDGPGDDEVGLCGGLLVDLELSGASDDADADVIVTVENRTDTDWQGTIELSLAGTNVPVPIGSIEAGETITHTVRLQVDPDRTYEIEGTLLIGP